MQSYPLDLVTLLHILSAQRQTGELVAEVRISGSRRPGRASLTLYDGTPVLSSCTILLDTSVVLTGTKAFEYLQQAGTLEWVYTAKPVHRSRQDNSSPATQNPGAQAVPVTSPTPPIPPIPPALPTPPISPATAFPVRVRIVSAEEFATLGINRVYRSVYNMTDGAKSVEDIALLLKKPVETIWNMLSILQERGMIQITPYRRGSNTSSP